MPNYKVIKSFECVEVSAKEPEGKDVSFSVGDIINGTMVPVLNALDDKEFPNLCDIVKRKTKTSICGAFKDHLEKVK